MSDCAATAAHWSRPVTHIRSRVSAAPGTDAPTGEDRQAPPGAGDTPGALPALLRQLTAGGPAGAATLGAGVAGRHRPVLDRAATQALDAWAGYARAEPGGVSRADRAAALVVLYELATGPYRDSSALLGEPSVAALRAALEERWLDELSVLEPPDSVVAELDDAAADGAPVAVLQELTVRALRRIAAQDRLPPLYHWVADEAPAGDVAAFLAAEGGPDGGFDDLVAIAQLGLLGAPKMEMARNYWDELGNGEPAAVHTTLHADLRSALALPAPALSHTVESCERAALPGLLSGRRWLQPELVGLLGMVELQAGPRCQLVLRGLRRTGAPDRAQRFYAVHAEVDPRHGQDWLTEVIRPLSAAPGWSARVVRGAWWRSRLNGAFLDLLARQWLPDSAAAVA